MGGAAVADEGGGGEAADDASLPSSAAACEAKGRSAANRSVLLASCVLWAMECAVAAGLMAFFPRVALERGASAVSVGAVFAAFPLATALSSPFVPRLSRLLRSRFATVYGGLILTIGGLVGFSRGTDVRSWLLWRGVQGAACALVDVPLMGLLLSHTADIAEDTGLLESVAGIAYMVSPAVGGALYEALGFKAVFLVLAALHALALVLVPRLFAPARAAEAELAAASSRPGASTDDRASKLRTLLSAAAAPAACFCLVNASLAFYDAALAPHARATLRFGPTEAGLVYLAPSLIYAVLSPFAGAVVRRFGARNPLILGCGLWTCALVSFGPPPLAVVLAAPRSAQRAYDGACLALWSVASGVGVACCYQAPLPLAKGALVRAAGDSSSDAPSSKADDELSALMSTAAAVGQVLGPVVGGAISQYGAQWDEPGCDLRGPPGACESGFFTTCLAFAALFALLAPCLLVFVKSDAPPPRGGPRAATSLDEPLLLLREDSASSADSSTNNHAAMVSL